MFYTYICIYIYIYIYIYIVLGEIGIESLYNMWGSSLRAANRWKYISPGWIWSSLEESPMFWEPPPPPLSVQQHSDLPFWPMVALYILCPSYCRASPAHCPLLPNLLILVFHHYLPMKFLSCLASSWCQMIPNIGPFTISKSLLTNSLTQKSIFLIIFSIPSSALLPATHLCWLIR